MNIARLSAVFRDFADNHTRLHSPLYTRLCLGIADDSDLLALSGEVQPGQLPPNILLAAVQYLLLKGVDHPLKAFYPAVGQGGAGDPFPLFRDFCRQHEAQVRALVRERRLQTNEVGRSALLLPAFQRALERGGGLPLALLEVGTSAGLNLLFDRYRCRYSDGQAFNAHQTDFPALWCEVRGTPPPIPADAPRVVSRVGVDVNPIDLRDDDALLWLRALIWAEDLPRAERFSAAAALARREPVPPRLVRGDALDLLPTLLAQTPADAALCVFHSMTLNQFTPENRQRFYALLREHGHTRPVICISLEMLHTPKFELRLRRFDAAGQGDTLLAYADPHGKWIEWQESA